jgi:hypothetical protein
MTHRTTLPTNEAVLAALADLRAEAQTTGRQPASLSLARRLGMANTTFRRHFPEIATELSTPPTPSGVTARTGRSEELREQVSTLRAENRDLRDHLELAIANIQRLTLDNHQLRESLEAATRITRIPQGRAAR